METGAGIGTGGETRVDEDRMGTRTGEGTETGAVAEMGTGTRMRTGTGTRTGSGRAKEMRRSARNRTSVVDAVRHFHSARIIISTDRGWRLWAPDSSVRKARCQYTRIAPRW